MNEKRIKVYENRKPRKEVIYEFIKEGLKYGFTGGMTNDLELAEFIKYKLQEQGVYIKSVFCYGNSLKYIVKIASKEIHFTNDESKYIVRKLKENRLKQK